MTEWFLRMVRGELTPADRVVTAVAPAVLLLLWFLGGMAVYAVRCHLRGRFRDAEVESRGSSVLVGMWVRQYFVWLVRPLVDGALRVGIPANVVTMLSVLLAAGSGVSLAAGRFALGGWLFVLAGICDFLDGRIARATGQAGSRGALLDSVLDRISDAAVLAGLAWYYRESWVLLAVLLALVGSMLVPYIRARAEGLHLAMKDVGLMQRTERIVYLGAAVALSPIVEALVSPADPHPPHRLAIAGIVLLAASTNFTAAHRLLFGLRALGQKGHLLPRPGRRARAVTSMAFGLASDALLVAALVTGFGLAGSLATMVGVAFGAVAEFTINHGALAERRFTQLSLSTALLAGGGVGLLTALPGVPLVVAWPLARAAIAITWSVPLRKSWLPLGAPLVTAPTRHP
ncbi:MAG: hypothetical protein AMXMBFR64_42590 [Myxococcales bacterium]